MSEDKGQPVWLAEGGREVAGRAATFTKSPLLAWQSHWYLTYVISFDPHKDFSRRDDYSHFTDAETDAQRK